MYAEARNTSATTYQTNGWLISSASTDAHAPARLVLILGLALALRLWGLGFGLPYVLQPDESSVIARTMRMWMTGDLDPRYLTYPSLFYYLQTGWQAAFGHLGGLVHPDLLSRPASFELTTVFQPAYYVAGRILTAGLGVLAVLATYLTGRRLSTRIGLLASLYLAVAAIHVQQSHYITVDATTALFTAFTAFFALGLLTADGRSFWGILVGSGIAAGLAAGTKYNAVLALGMPIVALALRGKHSVRRRILAAIAALAVCAITFLITTPYALLDRPLFDSSLHSVFQHYTGGHAGAEGNDNPAWYLRDLVDRGIGFPMTALALVGIPLILFRFRRQGIVLLAFVLPYYALLCSTVVRFDRNLLPMLPLIALLAACASAEAATWIGRALRSEYLSHILVVAAIAGPALYLAAYGDQLSDYALSHRFTEQVAADWADAHLPDHAEVATENWEGRVFEQSPRHFHIHWASSLGNVPFSSLEQAGVRYVITDSYTSGEFEGDAVRFPVQAARYRELRQRLKVLASIRGNGQERPGPTMTIYTMP